MEINDTQDISRLLDLADEENELARAKKIADAEGFEKTRTELPVSKPQEFVPKDTATRVDLPAKPGKLNAETVELIKEYSTRELKDEHADTRELRDSLARRLEDDKLRGYLDTTLNLTAKKSETLRAAIHDGDKLSAEEMEKRMSARFSDEMPPQETGGFEQAEMFQLGDGLTMKEAPAERTYASYDKDYETLGKRVVEEGIPPEEDDDGQIAFLPDETDVSPVDMDETEINLRLAFDMMREDELPKDDSRFEKIYRKKKKKKEDLILRYTDRAQNREINGKLRKKLLGSVLRLIAAAVLLTVLGCVEFGNAFASVKEQGITGVRLYLLIDLQLVFLCGLAALPALCKGIKGIFRLKLTSESMLAAGLAIELLYTAFLMILTPDADKVVVYGFLVGVSALCVVIAEVLNARRSCHAFRMTSTRKPKYVAKKLNDTRKESEEFGRFLYEDSEIYTVKRTEFVDEFSERMTGRSRFEDLYHFLLPVILGVGAVLIAAMVFLGNGAAEAVQAGYVLWIASIPTTAFFLLPLPLAWANRRGKKVSAAFIGNGVADEYSMASVLTFADTEVYPSNLVNVTGFKNFGDYRIDLVITDLAMIFGYLGGPLEKVFRHSVDGNVPDPKSIRVIENASDGICVAMDGRYFYIGKRGYLRRREIKTFTDQGDEGYENSVGSVMYVAIDRVPVAKLYIRYRVNPRFEQLLKDLHRAGICLGIKTMDPNITTDMVLSGVRFKKCPIAVLKQDDPAEVVPESEHDSSGIVCNSSLHNFLQMFSLCDKVRHTTRCNALVTMISVLLSFLAVSFLAVTGEIGSYGVLQATMFQLCCQVPVWLLSLFMI